MDTIMSLKSIPEKISNFLVQRQGRMYCDSCIQERLGLKWRQQVQLITATLGVTVVFQREFNRCSTCECIKQVTYSLDNRTAVRNETVSVAEARLHRGGPDVRIERGRRQGDDFGAPARLKLSTSSRESR
jgi:hypothetical protein